MSVILADTSGLYSLLNRKDQYHLEAKQFYDALPCQTEKEWSYADCALLATAQALATSPIFSFDRHIDQMALQRVPAVPL